MTNEQWLVYLWSIYPDGGGSAFFTIILALSGLLIIALEVTSRAQYDSEHETSDYHPSKSPYLKHPWWKRYAVPAICILCIFLSSLVPSREGFIAIFATPYAVEAGQSVTELLADPTSKLFKLNKIMDNALDIALEALEKP